MKGWRCLVFLGVFLASCTVLPTPTPTVLPTPTATPRPPASPTPTLLTRIMLDVWVPDSWVSALDAPAGEALQQQLRAFEQLYPQYSVRLHLKKASGDGGIVDLISTAISVAPSVLPDLVLFDAATLREAYQKALLSPLDVAPERSADWYPFGQQGASFGGIWYGVPYLVDVEHAVVVPRSPDALPVTWDKVLVDGYTVLFPAGSEELADPALMAWYLSTGAPIVDERGNPYLERAALETVYRFIRALQEGGWIRATQVRTFTDAQACWEAFTRGQGTLAVTPGGLFWAEPSSRGVAMPLPVLSTPTITPVTEFWAWGRVNQDPLRREATLALLDWLTAPERVSMLSTPAQMLPVSRAALTLWQLPPEQEDLLGSILEAGVLVPSPLVEQSIRRALQAGLLELLSDPAVTPELAATVALAKLRE